VHATLALAAATALAHSANADSRRAWNTAAAEPSPLSRYEREQQLKDARRRAAEEEQRRWEEMRDRLAPQAAKPPVGRRPPSWGTTRTPPVSRDQSRPLDTDEDM
jgi:hypothetical protein